MTTDNSITGSILKLMEMKGNICLTMIIPTHRLSPERRIDLLEVEKLRENARQVLLFRYPEKEAKLVLKQLDDELDKINYTHNEEGIGIFITENNRLTIQFPFPVEEKLTIGDHFITRDLLYLNNQCPVYFVLSLSEQGTRLFKGHWNKLEEIRDGIFPEKFEAEYLYNKPSRSTSYSGEAHVKDFERDKSVIKELRLTDFFRQTNRKLSHYINEHSPLIILGPEKEISWFRKTVSNKMNIIHHTGGAFHHLDEKNLSEVTWPFMEKHLMNEQLKMVGDFEEKIGLHRGVDDLQEIWNSARSGNALKLLVEKDFRIPGFIGKDDEHLYLTPPAKAHTTIPDAVESIIETVLEKNGEVVFTANGLLNDHNHLALITRY